MIEMTGVRFGYSKKEELFYNLNLRFEPGNIYGLIGRNGSGKSTLLSLIAGLVFPDSGCVLIRGIDARRRLPSMLADVFFLREDSASSHFSPSEYRKRHAGFYPNFDGDSFDRILLEFRIDPSRSLRAMSSGQQRQFEIAFGLSTGARIVLLDEPTNGLDIPSKAIFRRLVAHMCDEGRIFILSTHQARDLQDLIDPLIILDEGRIVLQSGLYDVSRVLRVRVLRPEEPVPDKALYEDRFFDVRRIVEAPYGGTDAGAEDGRRPALDLELLVNTVLANPEGVRAAMTANRDRDGRSDAKSSTADHGEAS